MTEQPGRSELVTEGGRGSGAPRGLGQAPLGAGPASGGGLLKTELPLPRSDWLAPGRVWLLEAQGASCKSPASLHTRQFRSLTDECSTKGPGRKPNLVKCFPSALSSRGQTGDNPSLLTPREQPIPVVDTRQQSAKGRSPHCLGWGLRHGYFLKSWRFWCTEKRWYTHVVPL